MLFGDEDKENSKNSTTSWDYETETESINTQLNGTREEGILDAIKDGLNYVDENKRNTEKQTNVPIQIAPIAANVSSYNVSENYGDDDDTDDTDDDDDEEISLLDFFFKGESAFTSTTLKPLLFNVTGKPLLNGMTNSPMQIQPILPENMKNESLKFSMLPISLYNMVKEDGSFVFDSEKTNRTHQSTVSHPLDHTLHQKQTIKETDSEVKWPNGEMVPSSTIKSDIKPMTLTPKHSTLVKKVVETSTEAAKLELKNNVYVRVSNQTTNLNKTENASMKDNISSVENTTQKVVESVTMMKTTASITVNSKVIPKLKPTKSPFEHSSTKATSPSKTSTKKSKITPITIATSTIRSTTKSQPSKSSTTLMQPLTTIPSHTTTVLPKITAVQINLNPSILETDISYDYSEPTLPPSLPNLKIIPFLPTDAVKNIIHKNDEYKSNYNYYQSSSDSNANTGTHVHANTAYSPFNSKPTVVDKYPVYNGNIADDRIDYDTYKMPSENLENLDYLNVYAGGGANLIQPASFQLTVNSKLDYTPNQTKIPITVNKNLTVKPPLPPFEPEHEYDLYNLPPQPQFQSGNGYNEYSVNVHVPNEPFSSEHNYNVPHFVTMPPMKELPHHPDANKDSIFSYGHKNKFIPPAKTEGTFFKKTMSIEK